MSQANRISALIDRAAGLAIIAACGTIMWSVLFSQQPQGTDSLVAQTPVEELTSSEPLDVLDSASTLGSPTATLALLEFSDYQCPFCGRHAADTDTVKVLHETFVDSGQLRYVFLNLPLLALHPFALAAATAAECAGVQGKFWEMHDKLFLNQAVLSDSEVDEYARELGLNPKRFETCLGDAAMADKIQSQMALATRLGITSTPTFILGTIEDGKVVPHQKIQGAVPYDVFKASIEELGATINSGLLGISDLHTEP